MFELGWPELLVIAVVAIVVIGPKDLPRAMRFVGQWTGKLKRMARDFQGQFNEALREAELDDVKKDVQALTKMDPLADVRKELASVDDAARAVDKPKPVPSAFIKPLNAEPASSAPVAAATAAAATAVAEPAPPAASEPIVSAAPVAEAKP
jgi:sec-independent protein translocase protein TatB